jgi:hypothetical protein
MSSGGSTPEGTSGGPAGSTSAVSGGNGSSGSAGGHNSGGRGGSTDGVAASAGGSSAGATAGGAASGTATTGDGAASGTATTGGGSSSAGGASGGAEGTSGGGVDCASPPVQAGGICASDCDCVSGNCLSSVCYPVYPSGVFNAPLPANPKIASNSAAIIQYYVQNWSLAGPSNGQWNVGMHPLVDPVSTAEGDDNLTALYFARATDPLYTIDCFESWGCPGLQGLQLHIPQNAQWQAYPDMNGPGPTRGQGSDDHLVVISPDGSTEYDFYEASQCFDGAGGNGVCLIGSGSQAAIATNDDFASGSVATATGWMVSQGLLLPNEILAGEIDHALAIEFPCHDGSFVAPATASDGAGGACPDTSNVLTEGQRVFFTASDATIDSWNVPPYTKTIAKALAHYGAYYADNQGYGGATLMTVNRGSYVAPGILSDLWPAVATAFGGIPRTGVDASYDMGFDQIPGGWTSWLAVCDRGGC